MLTRLKARAREERERAREEEERERARVQEEIGRERAIWGVFGQPELLRKIVENPSAGHMRLVCKDLRNAFDSTVTKLTRRVVSFCSTSVELYRGRY